MKCEIGPGDRKCKHCLRRNIDCSLLYAKQSVLSRHDERSMVGSSITASADRKIDLMRRELLQLQATLDSLVQRGAAIALPAGEQAFEVAQHGSTISPYSVSGLGRISEASIREDNMKMAMTRENSMEADTPTDANDTSAVQVEEPMSSLYEVTKLRNIRSNPARTARPLLDEESEIDDFISRGVITEREAQELYIT